MQVSVGDELVSLFTYKALKKGQVYKVVEIGFSQARGQGAIFAGLNPDRFWQIRSHHTGELRFRKVIRDEPKAADEEFINLLKKVKA